MANVLGTIAVNEPRRILGMHRAEKDSRPFWEGPGGLSGSPTLWILGVPKRAALSRPQFSPTYRLHLHVWCCFSVRGARAGGWGLRRRHLINNHALPPVDRLVLGTVRLWLGGYHRLNTGFPQYPRKYQSTAVSIGSVPYGVLQPSI